MPLPTRKPPRLRPGDTVAVVTPSYPGPAAWPHRLERGVAELERLGFRVRLMPHALDGGGTAADWVAATPEGRASDLNAAFADPEVRAVVAAIGGDHSAQMLPHLDWDAIAANPTILVGYSDVTVLSVAIWVRTGVITFSGPTLVSEFAEYPELPAYTRDWFLRAVTSPGPLGELAPSDSWTDEFLDWDEKTDLTRARRLQPNEGWAWLGPGDRRGSTAVVDGALIGGCLESLQHLRGTPFWPSPEQWDGAVLFIETSEEQPTPADVDAILSDYENMGVLDRVGALLVGRPYGYSDEQRADLRLVLEDHAHRYGMPVVTGMDFGHTSPMLTLPVGGRARLDCARRSVVITEGAVT